MRPWKGQYGGLRSAWFLGIVIYDLCSLRLVRFGGFLDGVHLWSVLDLRAWGGGGGGREFS